MSLVFELIFLILLSSVEIKANYCLSDDPDPYLLFTTKTPYDYVRGNAIPDIQCEPKQFWLLSRHGTRHAEDKELESMKRAIALHDEFLINEQSGRLPLYDGMCEKDLIALKNWKWSTHKEELAGLLTSQGRDDLYQLAIRFKEKFPNLFEGPYTKNDFYFRHTFIERTNTSCRSFIDGLFGIGFNEGVKVVTHRFDAVILPFENCEYWGNHVDNDTINYTEQSKLKETPRFKSILENVSRKLGFSRILKSKDISAMYGNCRFDKTEHLNRMSPWCAVFTKDELKCLEFSDDLVRYYKFGYGHKVNKKLGAMTLKHLLETFHKTIENNGILDGHKCTAMFSHDTLIDMFFAKLNYANRDGKLTADDYFLENRNYRSSLSIPFGANIAAILYDCGEMANERFKIQFLLNEAPMELPGCKKGLCKWSHLMHLYPDYHMWNLEFCKETPGTDIEHL